MNVKEQIHNLSAEIDEEINLNYKVNTEKNAYQNISDTPQGNVESVKKSTNIEENTINQNSENPFNENSNILYHTNSDKKYAYKFVKRFFDIILSAIASVLLLVPIAIIALMIVIKDFGNPFYFHKRVGKDGKTIYAAKLRTMKKGADDIENFLNTEQLKEYKKEYKITDDPRLIGYKKAGDGSKCFGAILRKISIDELPQIPFNILFMGNMSIVGPRPIIESELLDNYTPEQRKLLLSSKPGLTGYWQAYARNNATYESGERQKMEMYYVNNAGIWFDIKIIFKTVSSVISRKGAQ